MNIKIGERMEMREGLKNFTLILFMDFVVIYSNAMLYDSNAMVKDFSSFFTQETFVLFYI